MVTVWRQRWHSVAQRRRRRRRRIHRAVKHTQSPCFHKMSSKFKANFWKKKKVNQVRFHEPFYINELGLVKRDLVSGWRSVSYITCGCGSKQARGKQTRRQNGERSSEIMTGQDVIILSIGHDAAQRWRTIITIIMKTAGSILFPSNILYFN